MVAGGADSGAGIHTQSAGDDVNVCVTSAVAVYYATTGGQTDVTSCGDDAAKSDGGAGQEADVAAAGSYIAGSAQFYFTAAGFEVDGAAGAGGNVAVSFKFKAICSTQRDVTGAAENIAECRDAAGTGDARLDQDSTGAAGAYRATIGCGGSITESDAAGVAAQDYVAVAAYGTDV